MVPGSFAAERLVLASRHQTLVKRCRNDLKFDVEPFGCILRSSTGLDRRSGVSDAGAAESSCLAIGGVKLGQMTLEWPETSCVLFFWLSWRILQFLFDSDKIGLLEAASPIFGKFLWLHEASWCWGGKVTFLVSTPVAVFCSAPPVDRFRAKVFENHKFRS